MFLKPCFLLALALAASAALANRVSAACSSPHYDETVAVRSVTDGDTLRLSDGRKLRLIGINTPELARDTRPAEPLSEEARQLLIGLIRPPSRLHLRHGQNKKDRYGRLLAHAFTKDGRNLTEALLSAGLGNSIQISPNLWSLNCYLGAEKQARRGGRGIWGHAYFKPLPVNELVQDGPKSSLGFRIITGRISRIGRSRHALWLNLGRGFAIRIHQSDLQYFSEIDLDRLVDHTIVARGWIYKVKNQLRMNLHHPAAMQVTDDIPAKNNKS